jgi:hypothetical protein
MADAAAGELAGFTTFFDTLEDGASWIFRAMIRVAPPHLQKPFVAK